MKNRRLLIRAAAVGLVLLCVTLLTFERHHVGSGLRALSGSAQQSVSNPHFSYVTTDSYVIFPKSFRPKISLEQLYHQFFRSRDWQTRHTQYVQPDAKVKPLTEEILKEHYRHHAIKMYDGVRDLREDWSQCSTDLMKTLELEISRDFVLKDDIDTIVRRLLHQMQTQPEMRELQSFFKDGALQKQLDEGTAKRHWIKFAGTSIWLEEYKVHMMLSRMLYLPKEGDKRSQTVSLTYTQLYNEHWDELTDTELVVPTNAQHSHTTADDAANNGATRGDNAGNAAAAASAAGMSPNYNFRTLSFPSFLQIPFYFNTDFTNKRWYGPEDPRVVLVRNPLGYDEPVVVYNAFHRKVAKEESDSENETKLSYNFYRSMFMTWPFQTQRGKSNVDGSVTAGNNDNVYMRTVELKRSGVGRLKTQKNWTPFLDTTDREEGGGDRHIYFIYRWHNLEILKCDLTRFDGNTAQCEFAYRQQGDKIGDDADVGALRGGTQLIGLKDIIMESFPENTPSRRNAQAISKRLLPEGKQVWIGFARAHISGCCGNAMYRPNLAVITREDGEFKVSQLSSYMSLDIDVFGWTRPEYKCERRDANALIPNGIAAWRITELGETGEDSNNIAVNDYLTLSLSVSDETIQIVHIRNLLNMLLKQTSITRKVRKDVNDHGSRKTVPVGFNNDVVKCAMDESFQFCKAYGKWAAADESELKEKEKKAKEEKEKKEKEKKEKEEKERKEKEKAIDNVAKKAADDRLEAGTVL
ncbi:Beta-mannosyltransferase 1 [[Candida] zeylanoides]